MEACYICFAMEEKCLTYFYIGISSYESTVKDNIICKKGYFFREKSFSIFRSEKKLKSREEELQIYFSLISVNRSGFPARKEWTAKSLNRYLENTIKQMRLSAGYDRIIMAAELFPMLLENKRDKSRQYSEEAMEIPQELTKAHLRSLAPFHRTSVSFWEESGELSLEWAKELLSPYLPRMKQVTLVGEETRISEELEYYLYEEYGIIMNYAKRPAKNSLWIDLGRHGYKTEMPEAFEGIKRLNSAETLKFLDTYVKNGYNTRVN